jgi:hypothetical protein
LRRARVGVATSDGVAAVLRARRGIGQGPKSQMVTGCGHEVGGGFGTGRRFPEDAGDGVDVGGFGNLGKLDDLLSRFAGTLGRRMGIEDLDLERILVVEGEGKGRGQMNEHSCESLHSSWQLRPFHSHLYHTQGSG